MKVVIQQKKCKGKVELLPIIRGKVIKSKVEIVFPHRFKLIPLIVKTMIRIYK